ncbi:hypothetical protein AUP68_03172 [Ilyonectria robusta]
MLHPLTFVFFCSPGVMGHERLEVQARKFYSQRNMYLCGFTLFLSLILNRTYVMIIDVLRLEDKIRDYESTNKDAKDSEQVAALKKELELKDLDLQTLKKQSQQLHKSYDELSDKYSATQEDGEGTLYIIYYNNNLISIVEITAQTTVSNSVSRACTSVDEGLGLLILNLSTVFCLFYVSPLTPGKTTKHLTSSATSIQILAASQPPSEATGFPWALVVINSLAAS